MVGGSTVHFDYAITKGAYRNTCFTTAMGNYMNRYELGCIYFILIMRNQLAEKLIEIFPRKHSVDSETHHVSCHWSGIHIRIMRGKCRQLINIFSKTFFVWPVDYLWFSILAHFVLIRINLDKWINLIIIVRKD